MKVYFDTETELIGGQFGLAPPLITCGMIIRFESKLEENELRHSLSSVFPNQVFSDENSRSFYMEKQMRDGVLEGVIFVFNREDTCKMLKHLLMLPYAQFIAHNTAFDLAVLCAAEGRLLPLVFKALDEDRIHCTYLRAMMEAIANGASLKI